MKVLLLLCMLAVGFAAPRRRYVIMAPNVFYVGLPQKVHVALFNVPFSHEIVVEMYVELIPGHRKVISSDNKTVSEGKPALLSLMVDLDQASEHLTRQKKQFFLLARSSGPQITFSKTTKIDVSYSDGVALIQTDKPIYTPNQKVKIRVVPLGFNMMPSTKKINLIVKNPQDIRVRQWNNLTADTGFITKTLDIGSYPLTGNWTVGVYYGHLFVHNTSVKFEVREYILPKFSVKIKGPRYVLPDNPPFKVSVQAKYTYGKTVQGIVAVQLHVVGILKEPLHLYSFRSLLQEGTISFDVKMDNIKNLLQDKWFPSIEGHRLQIMADVTEKSTGKTESAVDDSIYFVRSPYRIKYIETARYFMPGLPFPLKVKLTYPNNEAAAKIPVVQTARAYGIDGNEIQSYVRNSTLDRNTAITDENGVAYFEMNVASQIRKIIIMVKTDDKAIANDQNAVKSLIVMASQSDELMKLKQNRPAKVGSNAACEAVIASTKVDRFSYFVVSRGQIVHDGLIDAQVGIVTTISFRVTSRMSPTSRLVAYYVSKETGKIVSDSILLEIEDTFSNQIFLVPPNHYDLQMPSDVYELKILGTVGTNVSLLGVDQSIYLLSKMNLLTPESVFKKLEDMDRGCGAGSGKNAEDVFKNAGIVLISYDMVVSATGEKCKEEPRRSKRSVEGIEDHVDFCCDLGNKTDPYNRNCYRRVMDFDFGILKDVQLIDDCKAKYFNCCASTFGLQDTGMLGRSGADVSGEIIGADDKPLEHNTRQFFPETWINEEVSISQRESGRECSTLRRELQPKCGSAVFPVSLPDTMTTWVVQAMGVSGSTGFGIAKPLYITTFKPFFIYLSMPYSVQRGEEITILATLFNYKARDVEVHLYLKGDERFCSTAVLGDPEPGTKLTSRRIRIRAQDSVSYAITIVPIKSGKIPIEVTATGSLADDQVLKELLVVPEGMEERMTQSYVLDPKEFFKGRREPGENQQDDAETLSFQSTQARNKSRGEQIDTILLTVNKKAIPGSIDAKVYLTGNMIGQAVTNIAVGELKHLLRLPYGCGEQNMNAVAPNVYALHYLQTTNQMTKEMESKKNDHIQKGYAHESNYRQPDGSYTYFRPKDRTEPGSTWLTAFVVKVFCQATKIKGIIIREDELCVSAFWLLKKQRESGAFFESMRVKYIIGLSSSGKVGAYTNNVTLTAFVLIALKQCKCGGRIEDQSVQKAKEYLERRLPNITDAYTLAVTTYALALVDSSEKWIANQKLVEKATFNSATSSRYWETGSRSRNIQTAAYALLVQLALRRLEYSGPIVVWLTKQRSSNGGFASTTDTSVALESLAKYSEVAEMNKLDMKVWIKNKSKKLNKDTSLLQQEVDIGSYLGDELRVETKGTGVGQMQVTIRYNVPSKKHDKCDFSLSIKITEEESGQLVSKTESDVQSRSKRAAKGKKKAKKGRKNRRKSRKRTRRRQQRTRIRERPIKKTTPKPEIPQNQENFKSLVMTICARYKKDGTTGMAIIDAGILTGYSVIEESLVKLIKKANDSIGRYELSDRSVVFYLNQIDSTKESCVAFSIYRDFNVGAAQPVPVKVYDYYEPDESCTLFYNLGQSTKSLGKCKDGGICTCTQGKCARANPRISNVNKMIKKVCKRFDFAIKGKVVLIDEEKTWLTYDVQVINVVKQRTKTPIKVKDIIEFKKHGICINPHLEKGDTVLIMGQIKQDQYVVDNSALVKKLDSREDEKVVDQLARRVARGGCDS